MRRCERARNVVHCDDLAERKCPGDDWPPLTAGEAAPDDLTVLVYGALNDRYAGTHGPRLSVSFWLENGPLVLWLR